MHSLQVVGRLVHRVVRYAGARSWLAVNLGRWFGSRVRRRFLVWCGVIPTNWPDFLADLEAKAAKISKLIDIDRVSLLPESIFQEHYAAGGKPVVLTGAIGDCKLRLWTFESLKEQFGDLQLKVRRGPDYDRMRSNSMLLRDYIDSLDNGQDFYMGNNPLPKPMWTTVDPPLYFPDRFPLERAQIWIGAPGTGVHLHRDLVDNFLLQLIGRKKVFLCSPDESVFLYTWEVHRGLNSSKVNIESPDYKKFPLAKRAHIVSTVLQPGDMLYLPCGWFHQTRNLDRACSVNFFAKEAVAALPEWQARRNAEAAVRGPTRQLKT